MRPALPASAVVERDGRAVVLEAKDGRAVVHAVRVAPAEGGFVTIADGVAEGTFVIDAPSFTEI